MNNNDIITALECCLNGNRTQSQVKLCSPCPFFHEGNCTDLLKRNALDLIKRQRAEIEKLKVREYRNISKTIQNARDEVIEDFAEKLKEKGFSDQYYEHESIVYVADIDDLVKEMKEDEHD